VDDLFQCDYHGPGLAGVDEVGRGPLAGDVVAAAVILDPARPIAGLRDSKKLSASRREELALLIMERSLAWAVARATVAEIDQLNILQASLLAMKLAVNNLKGFVPDFILVDGKFTLPLPTSQAALVKGESKSSSIAAASILAKITRDHIMVKYHQQFPAYNFLQNKGYPTRTHRLAIETNGICPIHRKTFRGVREYVK
jgi:ribonuclease HII